MFNRALFFLFAILTLAIPQTVRASSIVDEEKLFVMSGVILSEKNRAFIDRFVKYVEQESGYRLKPHFVDSYDKLSATLRQHADALAWSCSAPYARDSIKDGQQLIAVPLFRKRPLYHSLLITRNGRSEKKLADFRGQVMAYSDSYSCSGMIIPAYRLKKEGFDMNAHFRLLFPTGNHEKSIEAVLNSLADVTAVNAYVWFEYAKKKPEAHTRLSIMQQLGPFPLPPIVAGEKVPKESIETLRRVFVNMAKTDEGKALLQEMNFDGFILKPPSFYDPIKEMIESLYGPVGK